MENPTESTTENPNASLHLTVATVIYREGKFLMVRETDSGSEVINQPAGHVEVGETLQQAALRETLEETGWHIRLTGFLGIGHYYSPRNGCTYYRMSFCADALQQQQGAVLDSDIIACEWHSYEAIKHQLPLRSPMVIFDIEQFLKGIIYPLSMLTVFSQVSIPSPPTADFAQ